MPFMHQLVNQGKKLYIGLDTGRRYKTIPMAFTEKVDGVRALSYFEDPQCLYFYIVQHRGGASVQQANDTNRYSF